MSWWDVPVVTPKQLLIMVVTFTIGRVVYEIVAVTL